MVFLKVIYFVVKYSLEKNLSIWTTIYLCIFKQINSNLASTHRGFLSFLPAAGIPLRASRLFYNWNLNLRQTHVV